MHDVKLYSNGRNPKEQGFVAIIVAALIMIILSLITIGFTRIMQREQRQSLDRQLSRQALYAAESGINDIYSSLKNNANLPAEKTTCDVTGDVNGQPNPAVNGGKIDESGQIEYTCALYDKTPSELVYSVSTNESKIVELKNEHPEAFSSLKIRWSNEQGNNNVDKLPECGVNGGVFPGTRPDTVPLLRFDLTNTSVLSRDSLINSTDYLYLSPCQKGALGTTHTYSASPLKGQVVEVACADSGISPCELKIDGLTSTSYLGRLKSVYGSAQVIISATDSAGNPIEFKQAQTSIDVTARSSDVVRRLRVSIPLVKANEPPEAVFQSFDGVCKLLSVDAASSPARVTDRCEY